MKGRWKPVHGKATEQATGGENGIVAVTKSRRRGWGDAVRAVSFVGLKQGGFSEIVIGDNFYRTEGVVVYTNKTSNFSSRLYFFSNAQKGLRYE